MGWKLITTFKIVKAPWSKTYDLRHLRGGVSIQHIDKERFDELDLHYGDVIKIIYDIIPYITLDNYCKEKNK
jgi:hypothetical protein